MEFERRLTFSPRHRTYTEGDSDCSLYCIVMLVLPEGHKDGVPFLMHNNLLRQDSLGARLFLDQVVFAHKHPVGEFGAGGENRLLKPILNQTEDFMLS